MSRMHPFDGSQNFGVPELCTQCKKRDSKYAFHRDGAWTTYCLRCATPEIMAAGEQVVLMIENGLRPSPEGRPQADGEDERGVLRWNCPNCKSFCSVTASKPSTEWVWECYDCKRQWTESEFMEAK